tara:strand:+ start:122 stop:3016 length:2895 start_codon:yes stop_codon:yes gene_type:complete
MQCQKLKFQNKTEFYNYLKHNFPVTNENKFTHTSINDPKGSWSIPDKYLTYFYDNYSENCFILKNDFHFTEKHISVSPILIDIDLRYNLENPTRLFDITFIKKIINLYIKIIKDSYENVEDSLLESYILLKDNPIFDKDRYKDGIHIVFPYLVTTPEYQKWFRHSLLTNYKSELKDIFSEIHFTNSYADIFDDKVIFDTNWQLYGSKKPGNIPYVLKYILDSNCNIITNEYSDINNYEVNKNLIKLFSIRNKIETKLILNKDNVKMDKWLEDNKQTIIKKTERQLSSRETIKSIKKKISDSKIFGNCGQDYHLNYVKDLTVECLSSDRADNEDSWYKTGMLLHNLDYSLLDSWIEFSKKSPKFKCGECEIKWESLPTYPNKKDSGELSIGSLIYWAKHDNLDKYNEIHSRYHTNLDNNSELSKLLTKSSGLAHTDIANVLYRYFNGYGNAAETRFVCYNIPKRLWCEFKPDLHRWLEDGEDNAGHCIRSTFDQEIYKLYIDYDKNLSDKISKAMEENDEEERERHEKRKEKIVKLMHSLKVCAFRDTLLKESCNRFLYKDIRNILDTKEEIINFTNGVYDLENDVFRDGRPDDYITLSTKNEYINYSYTTPEIIQLQNILEKMLPIKAVREYFLLILSSCLSGKLWFEKFFVLCGSGSNGKSRLIEFINSCFGEYFHQMNVQALCSKRAASTAADPELALLRGKRIVTFQEPSKDETMNVGKLKEWTGGDSIQTRELYKGPIKFKPQAKWFLICNDIPQVPSDDDGTWRRLTIINFPSKFLPRHKFTGRGYEFEGDPNIGETLDSLKSAFIWLLIQYYSKFKNLMKTTGLEEPEEVKASTNEERKKNNPIKQFIDDKIFYSSDPKDKFKITEIYNVFKDNMLDGGFQLKNIPKREEFKSKFNQEYPLIIKKHTDKTIDINNSLICWSNVKYIIEQKQENIPPPDVLQYDSDMEEHDNIIKIDDF